MLAPDVYTKHSDTKHSAYIVFVAALAVHIVFDHQFCNVLKVASAVTLSLIIERMCVLNVL